MGIDLLFDDRLIRGTHFNDMERIVFENNDFDVIITEDFSAEQEDARYNAYVNNVMHYYLTELIIRDVRASDLDDEQQEKVIDYVGNVDVFIPEEICAFYKSRCNYELAMEEPS